MKQITVRDNIYMQRCLELAKMGKGHTQSNPMVGSVIVYNDKIIGEGYHQEYGKPHAEVNAINSVKKKQILEKATIYVNLEPCSHHGKTPPCSDLIIKNKIPRVVIGASDTNEKVGGKGIKRLRNAGIDVKVGVIENECRELNKRFYTFHEQQRPYIILKWAQTADGFIDKKRNPAGEAHVNWITSKTSRMLVHKWRSEEMAIMVGKNTIIKDNPSLTVRDWQGNHPTRIVIDKNLELSSDLAIFSSSAKVLVFNYQKEEILNNIAYIKLEYQDNNLKEILGILHKKGIVSLFVEGGAKLIQSFIDNELWDEARVFVGDKNFVEGVKAPELNKEFVTQQSIGNDRLFVYQK
jgi:diaminohydroxyphosphoribosylaminopyrimidine deaminase/5-amino-6-(5-phosphoribosylamino)uracil reductase